jgi:quinol-cytochrome oxidoreductase complex cytochrome b subunit
MLNLRYALMNDLIFYSVAENLTIEFNVGFMLGIAFVVQIVTGFSLATAFLADSEHA